jgi:membrane-bound lytic murein transglycosylase B
VRYWEDYESDLQRAEAQFGVPAEVILGILGVETAFGRHTGSYRVIDVLATIAFDSPRR